MFWLAVALCPFSILLWNVIGRTEYYYHTFSNLFGGDKKKAIKFVTIIIMISSRLRDLSFGIGTLYDEPLVDDVDKYLSRNNYFNKFIGASLFIFGQVLVYTSTKSLGMEGTYLGDYFGILCQERVVSFPYNILAHPMYDGAVITYLGASLFCCSSCGLALTAWLYVCYQISEHYFEGPFTTMIYSQPENSIINKVKEIAAKAK